jgi:replicative DNA helicase
MTTTTKARENGIPVQLAPYSQESEEAVLGSVLVDPEAFHGLNAFLKPADFYILRHAYIWEACTRLVGQKLQIDYVSVQSELQSMNRLKDIGGPAYLLHLINSTATAMHAETYGRMVQRAAGRRRMLICADELKALAMDEDLAFENVMTEGEKRWALVRDTELDNRNETFVEIVGRMMDTVEDRMLNPDQKIGITTGYRDLDDLTSGGLQKGKLVILAARPAMGKTSMLISVMVNAAKLGARVALASQEMDRDEIVQRMAAIETGINLQKIQLGRLSDDEWRRFVRACGVLGKLPIIVDDASRLTPTKLRAKCLRWRNEHGLDLLMVDYLQILSSGGQFPANARVQEVGYFARELKQIAREFHIPVYAAAQINRGVEERQDKRPVLSDLRESGEIEQEADIVQFIYRDAVYNDATEFPSRAEIIVAKHRSGPTGTVVLHFEKSTTKFSDASTTTIDLRPL